MTRTRGQSIRFYLLVGTVGWGFLWLLLTIPSALLTLQFYHELTASWASKTLIGLLVVIVLIALTGIAGIWLDNKQL